jgi:hypothetical protein
MEVTGVSKRDSNLGTSGIDRSKDCPGCSRTARSSLTFPRKRIARRTPIGRPEGFDQVVIARNADKGRDMYPPDPGLPPAGARTHRHTDGMGLAGLSAGLAGE